MAVQVTKADFKIKITTLAWQKIANWRDTASPKECGGISLVKRKGNTFVIYDSYLPKQVCTNGHTQLDQTDLGLLDFKFHKMGIPQNHKRVFWHTHPTFGCFWSGEDQDTVERLARVAKGFYISIVTNCENKYLCRLDVYEPFPITIEDIELEFLETAAPRYTNWKFQVESKISEPPPAPVQKHIWADNQCFSRYEDWGNYWSNVRHEPNKPWWVQEKEEEEAKKSQLTPLNSDIPNDNIVKEHYEIPRPKWYLDFIERKKKEANYCSDVSHEKGGCWVNHGGEMMPLERYLKEVSKDD